jgi:hypothetical protein
MSPQAGFILQDQVVPRLRSAIPNVVHCVGAEDAEELIQDGTAMAAKMIHNVEQAGKEVVRSANGRRKQVQITAGNVTYYTIEKLRCGRRSTGSSVVDVHASRTQINGSTRLTSLEDVAAIDEETGGEVYFHDVLSNDQEDPGTKAARKMDWDSFMAGLSERDQAVIGFLVEGRNCSSIARELRVCPSTIQHRKHRLAVMIVEFMGADILVTIQRRPNWRDDLSATKEKMACKHDRCGK